MPQARECLGCGAPAPDGAPVCGTCRRDPFAMETARGHAAGRGDATLVTLYDPGYAYLAEGRIVALWEDTVLGDKDTIPEFSTWRNAQSVRLVPRESARVLEVGVGAGHALRALSAARPAAELYGVDVSDRIVERLSREIPGTFAVASIEDLPWPGLQFDAILMLEVLEHIEAPRTLGVLTALRQRLRPGGALILSVPLREDLRRSYFVCSHCGHSIHQIGHLRSYTPALLRAELALAGYAVDAERPLAGGTYFGIRRQHLMPFFRRKIQPMVLIARGRAAR